MTTTLTLKVTFDEDTYPCTIQSGNVVQIGGNPGNCLDGGQGDPTIARIRVDLRGPSRVTRVKMDWWRLQEPPLLSGRRIILYDQNNNELYQYYRDANSSGEVWRTEDTGPISIANVSYGIISSEAGQNSNPLRQKLDNCIIEYQPNELTAGPNNGTACGVSYAGSDAEEI